VSSIISLQQIRYSQPKESEALSNNLSDNR
jgi:hypothetical protein